MAEPPALRTSSHDALGTAASSLWTDWKSFKQLFPSSSASDLQSQQTDTRSSQITSSDHGCQTSRCVAPIYERNNPERWYHIIIMNSAHHDWHTQYNTDEPWMYSTETFLTLCLLVKTEHFMFWTFYFRMKQNFVMFVALAPWTHGCD